MMCLNTVCTAPTGAEWPAILFSGHTCTTPPRHHTFIMEQWEVRDPGEHNNVDYTRTEAHLIHVKKSTCV